MPTTQSYHDGNLYVQGSFSCTTFTPPASCITNAAIIAAAGIDATKVVHQHVKSYEQESATTDVSESRTVHIAYAAGTIVDFRAGNVVAHVGAATTTFDLLKNGTTVLTGVISTSSANAAYALVAGTISSAAYVAGDVLEVRTVATAGGGTLAKGAFARLVLRENPA